ncbi:MBL fold metallo-hydrolase [Brevundimonas sp. 2R-24]|uniref:MBL fold metallo-hydrolase n=1 Tax=Peiella sedimenti TaxID=3061083 RepID=A0ABT8SNZ1_9CAUL|nr:MBL fold metallo-hydrolase [Caulobacteraceae bacterium XZ-24]
MRLLLLAASAAAIAMTTPAAAQSPPEPTEGARAYMHVAEAVAPGVTLLRQARPNFYGVVGNVLIIEQSDGLVLVDSGASYGSGRRVVEHVRRISQKPVKSVIITHWHNDHPLGLAAIIEAWPGAEIIATEEAARDFDLRIGRQVPRRPDPAYNGERFNAYVEDARQKAGEEGAASEMVRGYSLAAEALALMGADQAGTWVVPATMTFSERLTLADAERPIEIMQIGRGNTDGDLIVWLPNERIVAAGDIVVWPVPYMFNMYPREWASVIEQIKAMPFEVLIPGHGEMLRDRAYLDQLIGLQRTVEERLAPLVGQYETFEAMNEALPDDLFEDQRRLFAGDDAWLRFWFDGYALEPLMQSAYRELKGEPLGPPPPAVPPSS